jgi:hypothetical protein
MREGKSLAYNKQFMSQTAATVFSRREYPSGMSARHGLDAALFHSHLKAIQWI